MDYRVVLLGLFATQLLCALACAQSPPAQPAPETSANQSLEQRVTDLTQQVAELKSLVQALQRQLAGGPPPSSASAAPSVVAAPQPNPAQSTATPATASVLPFGFTFNAALDGYYEYDLNSPVGRVNELRAYDVSSNSFSLSQADLVIERAPNPEAGQRMGLRLDFQYGQATSTLQGNPVNELRPEVYRNVFQAYGTYVFPVANGLTVDFGKWASSLGIEGNYTKDQLNYSRSFWFDYLPFYHAGLRSKLAINDQWAVNLWIVNGTDQTEAFNNYKDQMLGLLYTPTASLTWTANFYRGQEHPDVLYLSTQPSTGPSLPNEQGTFIMPIANPPTGKLEIADTYLSWQISERWLLAAEADAVWERYYTYSPQQRAYGGAVYAGFQINPMFSLAARAEYVADVNGLFSGVPQYLTEGTITFDYRPIDGFLIRGEFRRDSSDRHYFLSHSLGVLESVQPTIGIGLVWWVGQKAGPW
jgi:hypothetical protein